MSRYTHLIFGMMLTLTLTGASIAHGDCGNCHAKSENAAPSCDACDKHAEPQYTLQLGLSGYSPVSYLDDNRAQPGSPQYSTTYNEVTYFFTSEKQRSTFEKNPGRYMPAYGGFCAFGCSVDSEFVPDPTSFQIINGKTHLFLKNKEVDAKALWRDGDQAELLEKADAYWDARHDNKAK